MNPDVLVIGAGAAGIGAGRALASMNVPFRLIEAKSRIGGRTHTDTASLGHLWDHGAHWFHSADKNPLRRLAEQLGHRFRAKPLAPAHKTFLGGKWLGEEVRRNYAWAMLRRIAEHGRAGNDVPAAAVLDKDHPWNPLARHWVALMYSVDAENVSTADAGNYDDSGLNLAVGDGYGALLVRLAHGLPVDTNTAARSIEVTGSGARIDTERGCIEAKAVVLAVPARIMERGRLVIRPAIPGELAEAFAGIPMGHYEKIALLFDAPVFQEVGVPYADVFDPVGPRTHPLNFELNPFGRPIAIAHIGGSFARDMESAGEAAMIDFAMAALGRAFGSGVRRRFLRGSTTHWTSDSFIGGAYTTARPGCANLRRRFLEPLHDRVFVAGEHASLDAMTTTHGAYLSGIRAAKAAARKAGSMVEMPETA